MQNISKSDACIVLGVVGCVLLCLPPRNPRAVGDAMIVQRNPEAVVHAEPINGAESIKHAGARSNPVWPVPQFETQPSPSEGLLTAVCLGSSWRADFSYVSHAPLKDWQPAILLRNLVLPRIEFGGGVVTTGRPVEWRKPKHYRDWTDTALAAILPVAITKYYPHHNPDANVDPVESEGVEKRHDTLSAGVPVAVRAVNFGPAKVLPQWTYVIPDSAPVTPTTSREEKLPLGGGALQTASSDGKIEEKDMYTHSLLAVAASTAGQVSVPECLGVHKTDDVSTSSVCSPVLLKELYSKNHEPAQSVITAVVGTSTGATVPECGAHKKEMRVPGYGVMEYQSVGFNIKGNECAVVSQSVFDSLLSRVPDMCDGVSGVTTALSGGCISIEYTDAQSKEHLLGIVSCERVKDEMLSSYQYCLGSERVAPYSFHRTVAEVCGAYRELFGVDECEEGRCGRLHGELVKRSNVTLSCEYTLPDHLHPDERIRSRRR